MYGLPQHTVDDVMATERKSGVKSGNKNWGGGTIGLGNNLAVPRDEHVSVLDITETRVDTREQLILEHLNSDLVSAGTARVQSSHDGMTTTTKS